jgi:hypothetical protein
MKTSMSETTNLDGKTPFPITGGMLTMFSMESITYRQCRQYQGRYTTCSGRTMRKRSLAQAVGASCHPAEVV